MAVFDPVLVGNMALNIIGIGQTIEDLEAEGHLERVIARWYPIVRDEVLADFAWPFATIRVPLALVEEFTDEEDPDAEWTYSYGYPTTCLVARRIVSRLRPEADGIPFEVGGTGTARLIFTDEEDAVLEMTGTYEDPGLWPGPFARAVAGKLADKISGPLRVASDKKALGMAEFQNAIISAKGIANQERRLAPQPVSKYISARGGYRDPRLNTRWP